MKLKNWNELFAYQHVKVENVTVVYNSQFGKSLAKFEVWGLSHSACYQ